MILWMNEYVIEVAFMKILLETEPFLFKAVSLMLTTAIPLKARFMSYLKSSYIQEAVIWIGATLRLSLMKISSGILSCQENTQTDS